MMPPTNVLRLAKQIVNRHGGFNVLPAFLVINASSDGWM
jgi:hypothetical protein